VRRGNIIAFSRILLVQVLMCNEVMRTRKHGTCSLSSERRIEGTYPSKSWSRACEHFTTAEFATAIVGCVHVPACAPVQARITYPRQ
jgi:hypothetical protein